MNKDILDKSITLNQIYKDLNYTESDKYRIEELVDLYDLVHELRTTKKNLGLTQDELSKRSKVPRPEISKILNGKRNITITTLKRLAEAMGKQLIIKLQ